MKKYIMGGLACLFVVAFALTFERVFAKELPLAPDFKLQDLSNITHVLSSNKNERNVLLIFWTTWCPYCQIELQKINNIYPELVKDGIDLLAIDAGESTSEVKKYVKLHNLGFTVLLDADNAVSKSYGVMGVPTFVLIDRAGRIVFLDNYFPKDKYKELISK